MTETASDESLPRNQSVYVPTDNGQESKKKSGSKLHDYDRSGAIQQESGLCGRFLCGKIHSRDPSDALLGTRKIGIEKLARA